MEIKIFQKFQKISLTVVSLFGNFLPRGCFSLIASCMITLSKNIPKTQLLVQNATFGSIKISGNEIFTGSLTGSEPEMTIFDRMGDFSEVWRSQLR